MESLEMMKIAGLIPDIEKINKAAHQSSMGKNTAKL